MSHSKDKESQLISLDKLIRSKLLTDPVDENNTKSFALANFWWDLNISLGTEGGILCSIIKREVKGENEEAADWEDLIKKSAKDLSDFEERLHAKIGKRNFNELKRGYLVAIIDIAKNQLLTDLTKEIEALKLTSQPAEEESSELTGPVSEDTGRKKKKGLKNRVTGAIKGAKNLIKKGSNTDILKNLQHKKRVHDKSAELKKQLEKLEKQKPVVEQKITQIRLNLMGQFPTYEEPKKEESKKTDKKEPESTSDKQGDEDGILREVPLISSSSSSSEESPLEPKGILQTIAQGNGDRIDGLKNTHYQELTEPCFTGVFDRFKQDRDQDFQDAYLFIKGNAQYQNCVENLLRYLIELQKSELISDDKKKTPTSQKSAVAKMDTLATLIQELTLASTLDRIVEVLGNALKSDRKAEGSILQNRGPHGAFWIGSMFKRERNPVDKKWINSTTEQKVAQAYTIFKAKQEELAELNRVQEENRL